MLRVTFYSYKGGVGRSLALLNVAAVLARHGRRVVAVDLDLEAPGFGLSSLTERPGDNRDTRPGGMRGVSDLILARREREDIAIEDCVYPMFGDDDALRDNLTLMPAGTRVEELIRELPGFYEPLDGDDAYLFEWLAGHIEDRLRPDYLLFDSRTGRADVAGVCTVELPDVVVAVCGLNEQNRRGMERVLTELEEHPARLASSVTVLVFSPVPQPEHLGVSSPRDLLADPRQPLDAAEIERERRSNPLFDAIYNAQAALWPLILERFSAVRGYFPDADRSDLCHELPLDPMVSLTDELQLERDTPLVSAYERLARSLTRLNTGDRTLDVGGSSSPPTIWPQLHDDT